MDLIWLQVHQNVFMVKKKTQNINTVFNLEFQSHQKFHQCNACVNVNRSETLWWFFKCSHFKSTSKNKHN